MTFDVSAYTIFDWLFSAEPWMNVRYLLLKYLAVFTFIITIAVLSVGHYQYWKRKHNAQGSAVAIIVTTAVAGTVIAVLSVEWILYAFAAILVPLYMRVRRGKVLDNFVRGRVYEYIRQYPGAHFRMIMSGLKQSMGVVRYHLVILQKMDMVRSENDGNLKRFYPISETDEEDLIPPLQIRILSLLNKQSGLGVNIIAESLAVKRQVVRYHLRELCQREIVTPRKTRNGIRYYSTRRKRDEHSIT